MAFSQLSFAAALGLLFHRGAAAILKDEDTCPGTINMTGYGPIHIVATKWNVEDDPAAKVDVVDGKVVPNLKGRAYFADSCEEGEYNYNDYVGLPLLGQTMRYTVDFSAAGCGCNAALYLTNLKQNPEISTCKDYYCDANSVCGIACPEIDIMEANTVSWHSTLHTADDKSGVGVGYGGGGPDWSGPREWNTTVYGIGARCIDTASPFQVAVSFPVWADDGSLAAMIMTLYQAGKPCNLTAEMGEYDGNTTLQKAGANQGMQALTEALRDGMTPIASFWESKDMLWMDGKGKDKEGPCKKDLVKPCPASISMYDFSLESCPPMEREVEKPFDSWFWFIFAVALSVGGVVALIAWTFLSKKAAKSPDGLLQE